MLYLYAKFERNEEFNYYDYNYYYYSRKWRDVIFIVFVLINKKSPSKTEGDFLFVNRRLIVNKNESIKIWWFIRRECRFN